MSADHPGLPFVQARYYSSGRGGKRPLWIVVHDMEAGESSTRAESTAAYFHTMPDGRVVSSHYVVDNDSVIQCVALADTAFTVGNTPGNQQGINWELAGFARQTREQWLDEFGLAMFAQMAPYVRADAQRYGIPLTRRTVAELKAFKPGITSHNDLRLAFGGTTHTDPGPAFPWDVFLRIIQEDDMPLTDADAVKVATAVWAKQFADYVQNADGSRPTRYMSDVAMLTRKDAKTAAEKPAGEVDVSALAAALVADPAFSAALEAAAEKAVRKVAADAAS